MHVSKQSRRQAARTLGSSQLQDPNPSSHLEKVETDSGREGKIERERGRGREGEGGRERDGGREGERERERGTTLKSHDCPEVRRAHGQLAA